MIVIDNFLNKNDFTILKEKIENTYFPWYWNSSRDNRDQKEDKEQFQLIHHFFVNCEKSVHFPILMSFFDKLNAKSLVRVKANLNPYSQKLIKGIYHIDQSFICQTSIFYINTNNGYTQFKKENKKVKSVANRLVTFKSNEPHLGTNCTNRKKRIVINFNYFK